MPAKRIDISNIGVVTFTKLARSRSIRLSISQRGVRVSMPPWTPYAAAIAFVNQQSNWIQQQLGKHTTQELYDGQKIGKLHTLQFEAISDSQAITSRVTSTKLLVRHYTREATTSYEVQARARTAAIRALRKETLQLLKPRLTNLAQKHGFTFATVQAKELTRRWGSCDNHQNITLNLYLMQLEWPEIDYVLCHELTHTEHMNHGEDFWARLTAILPSAKRLAKIVRHTQPALIPSKSATALDDDMAY